MDIYPIFVKMIFLVTDIRLGVSQMTQNSQSDTNSGSQSDTKVAK